MIAYVIMLALLAIGGIALWQHLPEIAAAAAASPDDWIQSNAEHPRLRGGL